MQELKKVLIISYKYPPRPGVGSNRIGGLAKYLPDFGWEPVILTLKLHEGKWAPYARVYETDFKSRLSDLKSNAGINYKRSIKTDRRFKAIRNNKVFSFIILKTKEVLLFPDEFRPWVPDAIEEGFKVIKKENIQAIISSSGPNSCHLIASRLCKDTGLPWIADLRDLWSQHHGYNYSFIRKIADRLLELKTLKEASQLITVSKPLVSKLKKLHKRESVYCITNGFDPDELNYANLTKQDKQLKFVITYTGSLFSGQKTSLLFDALVQLIDNGYINKEKIEVLFFGSLGYRIEDLINQKYPELSTVVYHKGSVNRSISLQKQRQSTILLLLRANPKEPGVYTGKIFEYLAARKPILSIGGVGGVVQDLLEKTQSGVHVSSLQKTKDIIYDWYQEFINYGEVNYKGNMKEINRYSHFVMTEKFAALLDNL